MGQREQIDKAQMLICKLSQIDKVCFSAHPRVKSRLQVSAYVIISICLSTAKHCCAKKWYTLQIMRQKPYYIQSIRKQAKHSNMSVIALEPLHQGLYKRGYYLSGFRVMSDGI